MSRLAIVVPTRLPPTCSHWTRAGSYAYNRVQEDEEWTTAWTVRMRKIPDQATAK